MRLFLAKQVECFSDRALAAACGAAMVLLGHVDLRLDRLAFPTSGHDLYSTR